MTKEDPARYRKDLGDPYPTEETPIQRLQRYVDHGGVVISPPEWRKAAADVLEILKIHEENATFMATSDSPLWRSMVTTFICLGLIVLMLGTMWAGYYWLTGAIGCGLAFIVGDTERKYSILQHKLMHTILDEETKPWKK